MNDLEARLHTIYGHLRALERLVASGRTLEASAQLRAVREALAEFGLLVYGIHIERCLRQTAALPEITELVGLNRAVLAARARAGRIRQRRAWRPQAAP